MSQEAMFKPASHKQELFILSQAFRTTYGGSAGGGKTHMGLMRFLLYVEDPNFIGFVIRKNASDLKGAGGAFDEALEMYSKYDPKMTYTKQPMEIKFSTGAKIYFTGLDGEAGMKSLQGKQISAIMLDESTHFTEEEIVWAESRLRTKAKMTPNIWLTCNPDMDSVIFTWIKDFYLYPEGTIVDGENVGGRANPEKDGVVRYFLKVGNTTEWGESREELIERFGDRFPKDKTTGKTTASPKSFTFISATCLDNPPLLEANPDYVSTLAALPRITRERLLFGNWLAREEGAGYFKREWVLPLIHNVDHSKVKKWVRTFDIAYSVPSENNPHPDYTATALMAKMQDDSYVVVHVDRTRQRAGDVEDWVLDVIEKDKQYYHGNYQAYLPQDPAAGQMVRIYWAKLGLARGIALRFQKVSSQNGKVGNFQPFSASAENGLIKFVKDDSWNEYTFAELEGFDGKRSTSHRKDDIVDNMSFGFNILSTSKELPQINASRLRMPV